MRMMQESYQHEYKKERKMDEIKKGDVLVFEAENDWISKSIALLTNSDVSHAALACDETSIAEMGLSGIQLNRFHTDNKGRKVYVLRMEPEKDMAPVVRAAQGYVDAKVQYDKPSLYFLAGLLIYRAVRRPTARWRKITDMIINAAVLILDKKLNRMLHGKDVREMVCSQLVYQCYYDCGKDYQIKIRDGILQDAHENGAVRLADLAQNVQEDFMMDAEPMPDIDQEMLAQELYAAIEDAENNPDARILEQSELMGTASKARKFLDTLERILEVAAVDMPLASLFVTPNDLLVHAENLSQQFTVGIERDKK